MRLWSIPTLVAAARRAALTPWGRKSRPAANRPRLELTPLEERVVLTAVAPNSYWDDGYYDPALGYRTGITVTLHNMGGTWLEVSGGGGAVSVAPGAPPTSPPPGGGIVIVDGPTPVPLPPGPSPVPVSPLPPGTSPPPASPPPPPPPSYSLEVWGALGAGSGDVSWSGGADNLYIKATGDVGAVSIGGDLYVDAGWTVGNVSARDVTVRAGKSVGSVTAADDVLSVTAGTSVGAVHAADDIGTVSAGASVGTVTAAGDVTSVSAGTSTGAVAAGGWLGAVSAGLDVGGTVSAGLSIGGAYVPGANPDDYNAWYYATYYGGVTAGRDVLGGVTAGGSIVAVTAGRDVYGAVAAGVDVWAVRAGGGGVYTPGAGDPYDPESGGGWEPYAPGRVLGPVTAGRDVHAVEATGDVLGAVTATAGFVLGVKAGGDVAGSVKGQADVGRSVTRALTAGWRPFGYYYTPTYYTAGVTATTGDVTGDVTATTGDVTGVSAGRDVTGAVTAANDIGSVAAGRHVSGDVSAGRDITAVRAGGSGMEMPEPGAPSGTGDLTGDVTAGRDVGDVRAAGDVTGTIHAGHGIGGITAGGDISSAVTAGAAVGRTDDTDPHLAGAHPYGSYYYGSPYGTGIQAGGDFTGTVTAGTDVGRVEAGGLVGGTIDAGRDVGFVFGTGGVSATITADRDVGRVYAGGYGYSGYYPTWGELPGGAVSGFTGSVDAAGDVYGVFVTGDVAGPVAAGGGIADVSAKGSVTGNVTAGDSIGYLGALTGDGGEYEYEGELRYSGGGVKAGADVAGTISAGGDVTAVRAGNDVTGSVAAGRDIGSVRAVRNLGGSVSADRDIGGLSAGRLQAYQYPTGTIPAVTGDLTATAHAGRDIRSLTATGDIDAHVTAGHAIGGVYAQGDIGGAIEATTGPIGRLTEEPAPYNPYDPYDSYRFPYSSEADAPGKVHAGGSIDAALTSGQDITRVEAAGDIDGAITAARDINAVVADGSIGATIAAGRDLPLVQAGKAAAPAYYDYETGEWVYPTAAPEDITGNLSAGRDITTVKATGSIDAAIDAGNRVTSVTAGGDIGGSLDAGEDVVAVTAGRHVSAAISAGRDVRAVSAGTEGQWEYDPETGEEGPGAGTPGDVSGAITAGRDAITVTATRDISGDVTAAHGVGRVSAGGSVTGDITATAGSVGRLDDTDPRLARFRPYGYYYYSTNPYAATGLLGGVHAGADVTGAISAGADVSMVEAGGTVGGSVDAGRDLGWVHGTAGVSAAMTVGREVGAVYAGAYQATYSGGWNRVDSAAPADFTGSVDAGAGVATVEATGSVRGSIVAGDSIGFLGELIPDEGEDDPGYADRLFGTGVWAGLDVDATINAGGDVYAVRTGRDIGGSITAGRDVCDLTAPRTISAAVTAGRDIGNVTVGTQNGGSLTGAVSAGRDVGELRAYGFGGGGSSSSPLPRPEAGGLAGDLWSIDASADSYSHNHLPDYRVGRPDLSTGGNIEGSVSAGSRIGTVTAFGRIGGDLTAGGSIGQPVGSTATGSGVWAAEEIGGAITAGEGPLEVRSWDQISGVVSVPGALSVWAYGSVLGALTSTLGQLRVGSWHDVSGPVTSHLSVDVRAFDGVTGGSTIESQTEWARVYANQDVRARVTATGYTAVFAGQSITGDLLSRVADVWAEAGQDITIASAWALDDLWASALFGSATGEFTAETDRAQLWANFDIVGSVTAGTDAGVTAYRSVLAPVTARTGIANVWAFADVTQPVTALLFALVEAGERVTGKVEVSGGTDGWGLAQVYARQDVTGEVRASGDVQVWSGGNITGAVTADLGTARVVAIGDVRGNVRSGWDVWIQAGGAVSGSVRAGDDNWSNATILTGADLAGAVTATGNVYVDTSGNVTAAVTALQGSVDLVAFKQIQAAITAGAGVIARAWGVSGDVTGNEKVTVTSFGPVSGAIRSVRADVEVYAEGDVSKAVTGQGNVFVRSLGSVTGSVTAGTYSLSDPSSGWQTATVFAEGDVSAPVTGAWAVDVDAGGRVAANLRSGSGGASVVVRGGMQGDLTTAGDARLTVFERYAGTVEAASATLDVFGTTEASVTATDGAIWLWGSEDVRGTYTANRYVEVSTLGSIDATVRAGDSETLADAYIEAGDNAALAVTATNSATVWVGGQLSGTVDATNGDATAVALGGSTATVRAGGGAMLLTFGDAGGSVSGTGDVVAYALGQLSAALTSTNGKVGAWAHGSVTGTIRARYGADITTDQSFEGTLIVTAAESEGAVVLRASGDLTGSASVAGPIDLVLGGDLTGSVASTVGRVRVTAAGLVSGPVTSGDGDVVIEPYAPVSQLELFPAQWVLDRITGTDPAMAGDAGGAIGEQFVLAMAAPPDVRVIAYAQVPKQPGRWAIAVYDKQGVPTLLPSTKFKDAGEVEDFIDTYIAANAQNGEKFVKVRLCTVEIEKQKAAIENARRAELQKYADEKRAFEEKKQRDEEARQEAERQRKAKEDVEKKAADQKLKLPAVLEVMPDGSQRWVTPQQDKSVREALDKPGGLSAGSKMFVIEDGKATEIKDKAQFYRPTKTQFDAAVKARYLELLDAEERAKPDHALTQLQDVLDLAGMIPVIGIPFDVANAGISVYRGDALGASLTLLGIIPVIGDAAQGAKIAKRGIAASTDAARAGKTAEKTAELLKNVDDVTKIKRAQEQAQLSLAAALETGYVSTAQVKASLQGTGRTADEADSIIRNAKAIASTDAQKVAYEASKRYFSQLRSGSSIPWQACRDIDAATAAEKELLKALGVKKLTANKGYDIDTPISDETLLLLSELNKCEYAQAVLSNSKFILTKGTKNKVTGVVEKDNTTLVRHTHPGINELVPSPEDLAACIATGAPIEIISRNLAKDGVAKLQFSVDEAKALFKYVDPNDAFLTSDDMAKFAKAIIAKYQEKGYSFKDTSLGVLASDLGLK